MQLSHHHRHTQDKIHVVAVPYPTQGHITPLMHLCQLLALEGFTITFVNTEHNHVRLLRSQALAWIRLSHHREPELDFRLVGIPGGLPPELHGTQDQWMAAFQASEDLVRPFEELLQKLSQDGGPPVSFVLSDAMMSWTQESADRFGIPRIAFWTTSAAVYSVAWYTYCRMSRGLPVLEAEKSFLNVEGEERVSCMIPGLPPMELDDLPSIVRSNPGDFLFQFLDRQFKPLIRASCLILNTFRQLEKECIDAMPPSSFPIYSLGPLLPSGFTAASPCNTKQVMSGASIFSEDKACLDWLDGRTLKSVLYVSFGSIFVMTAAQFGELAAGLESSHQPFLWVTRPNFVEGGVDSKFLEGFLSRTKDRGLVVSWVPQLQVLSHPAIGGFLTHCGWNSVLESVALGVPMLCWPDAGERRTNGRLAVGLWKVGLDFTSNRDGSVGREEVERVIRELMAECGVEIRERAVKLREAAIEAVQEGGSSFRHWQILVQDMKRKALKGISNATLADV